MAEIEVIAKLRRRVLTRARGLRLAKAASYVLLTCSIWLVYALSPVRTSTDSRWSLHVAHSFLSGNWGELSEYTAPIKASRHYGVKRVDEQLHSFFPIGASLLAMPLVAAADVLTPKFVPALQVGGATRVVEAIFASLLCALTGAAFFGLSQLVSGNPSLSIASTLVFAFCTSQWSTSSRALWQHGPLNLCVVLALLSLISSSGAKHPERRVVCAAVPLAFAFIVRPTAAIAIVCLGAYVALRHRAALPKFLAVLALMLLPWLSYNQAVWGQPLPPYYLPSRIGGHSVFWEALLGHLLSPSRGLFIYSPVLLLGIYGYAVAHRDLLARSAALAVILHWLAASSFSHWWGGYSYGPRLMSDVIPYLGFLSLLGLRRLANATEPRRAAATCLLSVSVAWSLLVHAQGALAPATFTWNIEPETVDARPERLWDWRDAQFARAWGSPFLKNGLKSSKD